MATELSPELKKKFSNLTMRLEPENLSCDGELSRSAQRQRVTVIMHEWKAAEKEAGRKVTEDEATKWYVEEMTKGF